MTTAGVPDVTVVVAVYNTMPYLTECLNSLVEQSIGLDRLQVVAVDDGSTDGSAKELARFATLHPGVFTVITQANSGGPAAPSNRGLEAATGRYVFFVGSDDYLGREALERMVGAADEHGTDVVVGKMVGVNGRWVPQAVFERTRHDATLRNCPLPWALSNTKLFRRSLVEEHGLRYPEDLPILSDQPFTLEACFRAAGISILADYDYYYAVRRGDEGNVTYRGNLEDRLAGTERIMRLTERFTHTTDERYGLNRRHLTTEMSHVLGAGLLTAGPEAAERIVTRARPLLADFATDALLGRLPLQDRVHLMLAKAGAVDALLEALRFEAEHGADLDALPLRFAEGRAHIAYPFVGDPDFADVTAQADRTAHVLRSLGGSAGLVPGAAPALQITASSPYAGYQDLVTGSSLEWVRVSKGEGGPAASTPAVRFTADGDGVRLAARLPLDGLLRYAPGKWSLRLQLATATGPQRVAVTAVSGTATLRVRRGARLLRLTATVQPDGLLTLVISPIRLSRIIAQRLRRLRAIGRK
ncbi:glycosyltransferase family 2 protein [Actinacidiphila bryophytorum]|uniref:glycosyltransferase family 2 protein n=1 Tax=Actinacidiphila bryophytorum TaxID=1436133 RepID=UPI002176E973|nr:glycosyltransferase family 2 protein [Actinacidiphila bryophytorum]UWE08462.1 glycosyltransferase [Actinacidiphila bryophytorum]